MGDAERGVLRRGTHRELVHVRLAEDDDSPGAQSLDDGGVVRRAPPLEDLGPACRRRSAHGEDVLQRQRHAGERTEYLAVSARAVDRIGLGGHQVTVDVQKGVHSVVGPLDPVEVRLSGLPCRHVTARDHASELGGAEAGQVTHCSTSSRMRGTRNRSSFCRGCAGESVLAGEAGDERVRPGDVDHGHRMRRRRHVIGGHLRDPSHRAEDHVELLAVVIELGVGQLQAGQACQVGDVVAVERRHGSPAVSRSQWSISGPSGGCRSVHRSSYG